MTIAWDPSLAVGHPVIDEQHQVLFQRVALLLEAMHASRGKDEVGRLMAFLEEYVETHFRAEERLMFTHGYPERLAHAAQHAGFVETFLGLKSALARGGPSTALAVGVNHAVCGWLRAHIGRSDREFGAFLQARSDLRDGS
jgi:hemerythrin